MPITARRFNPAGRLLLTPVQPIEIEGKVYRKAVPTVICYIDNSPTGYREFTRFCRHVGLVLLQDTEGHSPHGEGVWEVCGPVDLLERLTGDELGRGGKWYVKRWHPVISASHQPRASGAMPKKR